MFPKVRFFQKVLWKSPLPAPPWNALTSVSVITVPPFSSKSALRECLQQLSLARWYRLSFVSRGRKKGGGEERKLLPVPSHFPSYVLPGLRTLGEFTPSKFLHHSCWHPHGYCCGRPTCFPIPPHPRGCLPKKSRGD